MNPLSISLMFVTLVLSLTLRAQDARKIIDDASKNIEFSSFEMATTLQIHDGKGNVRTRSVVNITRRFGNVTKTLIRFTEPADVKGTAMLIYDYDDKDDDMWIYLPALRRSRRVVSSEKSKSFMGSEFSNADMSKPNLNDFTYKSLPEQSLNNTPCWVVESIPVNQSVADSYGFARKISYVEKAGGLMLKSDFYDKDIRLVKSMTFDDYHKQSNGKYFAYKMEMTNLMNKRYSLITVTRFVLGPNLAEENFSTSELEKVF